MNNTLRWIGGVAAGIGLAVFAAGSARAAKPVAIEKELLGIRVLQNYREVLLRYGAPSRVFRATEHVTYSEGPLGNGAIMGVIDSGSSGGGMGGPMAGGMAAAPGGGGSPYPGGGGAAMRPGSLSPNMTGSPSIPQSSGGPSGGTSGGEAGAEAGDNPDGTYAEAGGFIWVYLNPLKGTAYEFNFNKDGRVERITELGSKYGQPTSRGVSIGDPVDKVYSIYGWTDQIRPEDASRFSLLYNDKYHVQFVVLKNRVIGISVFLKENQFIHVESTGGAASGGGPPMAGMSGGGGSPYGKGGGSAMAPSTLSPSAPGGGGAPANKRQMMGSVSKGQ